MFKIDIFTILSPIFPLIFNIGCLLALFKTYTSPNLLFPILKSKIPNGLKSSYKVVVIDLFNSKFNVFSSKTQGLNETIAFLL